MKKKFRKALLALLTCGVVGLTSCQFGSPVDVDRELPTDDPTSATEIVFWHCLGHDKTSVLQNIVDKFNAEYAGKYQVRLQKVAGDYDSLHENIKTRLAANEVPALAMGYPDSFSEYISSDMNYSSILRLDSYIDDPNYGYTDEELDDFVSEYIEEGRNYQFEGTWSMPMYKSTEIMYYDVFYFAGDNQQTQKKFESIGGTVFSTYNELLAPLTGPKASDEAVEALRKFVSENDGYTYDLPDTWDEMITVARAMNKDRQTEGVNDEFYPVGYDSDSNLFISQFAQRGISYTVNDETSQATPSAHYQFNNNDAKEFATEIYNLIQEKVLITKGSLGGDTYTNEYFNNRKCVMSIGSTGGSTYQWSDNFKVGLAPVPYSGDTPKYIMQGPSICFFNNENDYIHKGAWLFYKMMADPVNNAQLALQNSYDPIRNSSYETTDYLSYIGNANKGLGLNYDIPNATKELKEYYMTTPVFIGSSTARDQIGMIIQYMVGQKMSVEQAFETAYNTCVRGGN